jgi:hypothetical protein
VFARLTESGTHERAFVLGALALAVVLAWLTYHAIERPLRVQPHWTAWVLLAGLGLMGCLGLAMFAHTLQPRSVQYGVNEVVSAAGEWGYPGPNLKSVHDTAGYYYTQGSGTPKVLFVGDSNMQQYYPRVDKLLMDHPDQTRGALWVTEAGCLPIPVIAGFAQAKCTGLAERARAVAGRADVDTIVLGAAWAGYSVFSSPQRQNALTHVTTAVAQYRELGRTVYLILPSPTGSSFDPTQLVTRRISDLGFRINTRPVDRATVNAAVNPIVSDLIRIAAVTGTHTLDPMSNLCTAMECPTIINGAPLYMDAGHLRPTYVRDAITFLDPIVMPTTAQH